ncbi:hypothetical protein EKO23_04145 [Nocardioides guangzhouensis]|uniref:AbiEi antitoxin N-terminal domain-containing protein n=1 Tax=Nocardioides guangzhouensis TaxID=2497878 RepID=A0A4Q4ZJM5_9ACTN|nr:type IV toxin-antitoxin system AbiEi family antitoxin domain-containing protein [Nocardioides guangzhouensis]RYP88045.1 hypothetical protein EKO23_04145 [Nocardioides guangzhouensis]
MNPDHAARTDLTMGLFTRADVLSAGNDDNYIARMVKSGAWHRVRNGAFMAASQWGELDEAARHRVLARAVLSKTKSRAVLSHGSALLEYGVPAWDLPLTDVHLTRLDQRGGRREARVCQHRGRLFVGDVTYRNGLMVTSPVRTALDVMATTDSEHGLVVGCGLVRAGECTVPQLVGAYEAVESRPHSLATRVVLSLIDPRLESLGEMRTYFHLRSQGLPTPIPQFEVRDRGRLVARLDFAWPAQKVWLEFDGKSKYVDFLREGETPADAVMREKFREDEVRRLTGWICIRVTWADLYDPVRLARKVRRAFADQAAA